MSQHIPSSGIIQETREISRRGWFEKDGRRILLARAPGGNARDVNVINVMQGRGFVKNAQQTLRSAQRAGEIVLTDTDALAAARDIEGPVLVMSFAHPWLPGGGFLKGQTGQEPSICRSSTLYESLSSPGAQRMYAHNARLHDKGRTQFDDYLLISPSVGVFRNRAGDLLDDPYNVAVASVPAPLREGVSDTQRLVGQLTWFLATGAALGYRSVVLGAWGCGYCGFSAGDIAECFVEALIDHGLARLYDRITFALPNDHEFDAFRRAFPGAKRVHEAPSEDPSLALVHPYLPSCNYHFMLTENDLGYVQDIMADGTPFVAEAHVDGDAIHVSFYYPYREDLSGSPEDNRDERSAPEDDTAAGNEFSPVPDESSNSSESESSGTVLSFFKDEILWHDSGILDLGMLDYGQETDDTCVQANVEMLVANGLIEFTTEYMNGAVLYRCDLAGQDITRTTIVLRDEEFGDQAHCPLLFHPFPDQPVQIAPVPDNHTS